MLYRCQAKKKSGIVVFSLASTVRKNRRDVFWWLVRRECGWISKGVDLAIIITVAVLVISYDRGRAGTSRDDLYPLTSLPSVQWTQTITLEATYHSRSSSLLSTIS